MEEAPHEFAAIAEAVEWMAKARPELESALFWSKDSVVRDLPHLLKLEGGSPDWKHSAQQGRRRSDSDCSSGSASGVEQLPGQEQLIDELDDAMWALDIGQTQTQSSCSSSCSSACSASVTSLQGSDSD